MNEDRYTLDSNFSEWYKTYFPEEPGAEEIRTGVTFRDLLTVLEAKEDGNAIFEAMGTDETEVRIALFNGLSFITGKPFEYFSDLYYTAVLGVGENGEMFEGCEGELPETITVDGFTFRLVDGCYELSDD